MQTALSTGNVATIVWKERTPTHSRMSTRNKWETYPTVALSLPFSSSLRNSLTNSGSTQRGAVTSHHLQRSCHSFTTLTTKTSSSVMQLWYNTDSKAKPCVEGGSSNFFADSNHKCGSRARHFQSLATSSHSFTSTIRGKAAKEKANLFDEPRILHIIEKRGRIGATQCAVRTKCEGIVSWVESGWSGNSTSLNVFHAMRVAERMARTAPALVLQINLFCNYLFV